MAKWIIGGWCGAFVAICVAMLWWFTASPHVETKAANEPALAMVVVPSEAPIPAAAPSASPAPSNFYDRTDEDGRRYRVVTWPRTTAWRPPAVGGVNEVAEGLLLTGISDMRSIGETEKNYCIFAIDFEFDNPGGWERVPECLVVFKCFGAIYRNAFAETAGLEEARSPVLRGRSDGRYVATFICAVPCSARAPFDTALFAYAQ